MKKLLIILMVVAMASFLFVGCLGVTPDVDEDEDVVVTIAAIPGVTAPVTGATPVTAITATAQYTGVVTWSPVDTTFAAATAYTATITLTAETGYTLTGVAADFFTVADATTDTNPIDSGVVTAVFPATAAAVAAAVIDIAAIPGVTAPVTGATPVTTITATAQYTGVVTWSPVATTFAAATEYTATITLTAETGYTLTGVAADFFTVADATTDTNPANSGVVTAVFPATAVVPTSAAPVMTDVQTSAEVSFLTVTSTSTQYMNKAEAGSSILVTGTAASGSLVQIYLDGVVLAGAVGETLKTGLWTVAVAKSALGEDGAGKVLHATATEVGLAESAASNSVKFTLDTDLPGILSVAATATKAAVTGVETTVSGSVTGTNPIDSLALSGNDDFTVVAGDYVIKAIAAAGAAADNITITTPAGVKTTYYGVANNDIFADVIPGIDITFVAFSSGDGCTITNTAEVTATVTITGRATLTFDEHITYAAATATTATYAAVGTTSAAVTLTAVVTPSAASQYSETLDTLYWTTSALVKNETVVFTVSGVKDAAGNEITALSTASCKVGTASVTDLLP